MKEVTSQEEQAENLALLRRCDAFGYVMPSYVQTPIAKRMVRDGLLYVDGVWGWERMTEAGRTFLAAKAAKEG